MPKINNIYYCPNCGNKIIWECRIPMKYLDTYGIEAFSMLEDTYKPDLLFCDGQIAKLRFTCKRCGYVDEINYDIHNSHKP